MQTHIARSLHDDHVATLALLARLETLLGRNGPTVAPDAAAAPVAALLRELERAVALELGPHFSFEETHVFPLLAEEHAALLPCAQRLAELARQAQAHDFSPANWAEFHAAGAALAGALAAHADKEDMGLLPALDALLDAETDARFSMEYAALR